MTVLAAAAAACLALAAGAPQRPAAPAVTPRGASRSVSVEELAEAQAREREAVVDARERRARAGAERLEARVAAALEDARRLEEREQHLARREQQLELRAQRVPALGIPTAEQRRLESLEAQLASQERQLAAQERSFAPALAAAARRERDAARREDAEPRDARRSTAPGTARTSVERRRRADEQEREVAALEERLVAMGDRLEALERQLDARRERLEARSRRLDARAERLDLLERRAAAGPASTPAAAPAAEPRPAPLRPAEPSGAPRERVSLALVVKAPTAILEGRGPGAGAADGRAARHPGLTVDRTVTAATVVSYPSPAAALSELDLEGVDRIARVAARERCELLIWARTRDPAQLGEAQRRASELRTRALAAGPLDGRQVVTRLTTRPGAQGVDVMVSALRDGASAAASAAPAPAPAAAAGRPLEAGEGGKRQIREAVQAAQPTLEPCLGDHLEARRLRRAEGVLKLTVTAAGQVARLEAGGDLAGTEIEECLGRAAATWALPGAGAAYAVDVPVAVFRGAPAPARR